MAANVCEGLRWNCLSNVICIKTKKNQWSVYESYHVLLFKFTVYSIYNLSYLWYWLHYTYSYLACTFTTHSYIDTIYFNLSALPVAHIYIPAIARWGCFHPVCLLSPRDSEVIMFPPGVFVCLYVSMFVTMIVRTIYPWKTGATQTIFCRCIVGDI